MVSTSKGSTIALLNGLFAVSKPTGITSAKVVNKVKSALMCELEENRRMTESPEQSKHHSGAENEPKMRRSNQRRHGTPKIGHGGTLDMNASGVLVIGIGKGTKQLSTYLKGQKKYHAHGSLGIATDTMDSYGKQVEIAKYDHVKETDLKEALRLFIGNILQIPPVYSALKVEGERMSDLVKRGIPVEPKAARQVQVHSLHCLRFEPPEFEIEISCGGGFYVRKLIHDLGKAVGTCAHMTALCRTQQGYFTLNHHALPEEKWTLDAVLGALEDFRQTVTLDDR